MSNPPGSGPPRRRGVPALVIVAAGVVIGAYGFIAHPGHASPAEFGVAMIVFIGAGIGVYLKQRRQR